VIKRKRGLKGKIRELHRNEGSRFLFRRRKRPPRVSGKKVIEKLRRKESTPARGQTGGTESSCGRIGRRKNHQDVNAVSTVIKKGGRKRGTENDPAALLMEGRRPVHEANNREKMRLYRIERGPTDSNKGEETDIVALHLLWWPRKKKLTGDVERSYTQKILPASRRHRHLQSGRKKLILGTQRNGMANLQHLVRGSRQGNGKNLEKEVMGKNKDPLQFGGKEQRHTGSERLLSPRGLEGI